MTKSNNFNKYLITKCLIGNGVINGIFNAIIFYLMEKGHPDKIFMTQDIVIDLGITSLLLGLLLTLIVYPMTVKDVKSGHLEKQEGTNKIANFLPKNKNLAAVVIGLITTAIIVPLTWVIVTVLNLAPLTVTTMGIFKGIMCAIAGTIAGYMTIVKVAYATEVSSDASNKKVA